MTSVATVSSLNSGECDLVESLIDRLNPLSKQLCICGEDIWGNSFISDDLSSCLESESEYDGLKIVEVRCDGVASCESGIEPLYDKILCKLECRERDSGGVSCRGAGDFFGKLNELSTARNWSTVCIFLNCFDKLRGFDASNMKNSNIMLTAHQLQISNLSTAELIQKLLDSLQVSNSNMQAYREYKIRQS